MLSFEKNHIKKSYLVKNFSKHLHKNVLTRLIIGIQSPFPDRDSHECDIGYCRAKCNSWEYVDWGLTTGCGDYYCCVQR